MEPIFTTPTRLRRPKSQTLKHGPFLFERIVVALTTAELVLEVLVITVISVWLLPTDISPGVRLVVRPQGTWRGRRNSRSAAVAGEIALLEYLDKSVLAVALDGASVADARRGVLLRGRRGRRVAGQAGEDILAEWSKDFGAGIDGLKGQQVTLKRSRRENKRRAAPRGRQLRALPGRE